MQTTGSQRALVGGDYKVTHERYSIPDIELGIRPDASKIENRTLEQTEDVCD